MAQSSLNCNVGLKHLFYLCKSILLPFQTEVKRIFQHLSTCPHMIVICYSAQRLMIWISDDPRVKMQLKLEFTASFSNSDRIKTLQTVRAFPHFALLPLLRENPPQLNANKYNQERLQHIISRWTKDNSDQAIIVQMTHGIHCEATEMNTGAVSKR